MKENSLITVIVPVYNIIEYLPRCVASIQNQTHQNLEIILVDDGSTDGTGSLCDELAEKDSRILVIHKENGGSSSARNKGLEIARGEAIGFIDSDDYIESTMYELLMTAMTKTKGKIIQIGRREIAETGEELPNICIPPKEMTYFSAEQFIEELLMHRGDCSFCTKLIHKDMFACKRFPIGALNEDFKLLVELLREGNQIVSLPQQTYFVFYRQGSNTRKKGREEFSRVYGDCVVNADEMMKLVQDEYPELISAALRFNVFQRLEYLLHIPISQMNKDNHQYREIVKYMRSKGGSLLSCQYLTTKNKIYSILFAIAPKMLRSIHNIMKGKK